MTPPRSPIANELLDQAVEWMLRLEAPHADEAEWLAFDAWVSARPEHGVAFDHALTVAAEVRVAAETLRGSSAAVIPFPTRVAPAPPERPPVARRMMFGGMAAAAVVAVSVAIPVWSSMQPVVYQTEAGERRTVTLKDGSRVDLNGASRLSVKYSRNQRAATLDGEAVFDVTHDASRPFRIEAGDRQVRVLGTQFDVRRREGRLSVVVSRGLVEVAPGRDAVGRTMRLTAGHRLDHQEGSGDGRVTAVSPEDTLGWRAGRLVYRNARMADVVADLNAQYPRPMTLNDGAGSLRFSGVIVIDEQEEVVRRLSLLAPIASTVTKNEIILRPDPSTN